MTEAQSQAYSLMFEGPADEQPQTLQRIKSVFIADLDLPIPQVQQILSNTPALVKAADDKESLLSAYGLLKRAGAKVLIVARSGVQEPESDLEELIGMVDLTEELTVIPQGKGHLYDRNESGADELEFEVFVGDAPSSTQRKSAGPKVYTLDLEETPDLSELSSSAEEVSEATETTSGKAEVTAREDLAAATATEDFAPPLELDESSLDDEAPVSNIEILPLGETEQTENDTASAAPQPLTLSFDEPAPPAALKAESGASNDVVKPESTPSLFEFDQPVEADKPGPAESSPRPEAAPPAVPLDLTIAEEAPTEAKESPKSAASNHPGEISAADTSPLNQIQIEPEVKATNPMPAEEPKDIVDSPAVSPVKTRPSADEADEVESAPALSKEKKKRASKVPWDIIIPISLGTLIIWYGRSGR
ncbi:MAG: hypothetical protein DCC75_14125 [Proteobacteria bacterium]|nr:MAG: hypothetical protein DCC75_14125 [Pseudomonadota bacterium]